MNPVIPFVNYFSLRSRKKRAAIFQNHFLIDKDTKILDLGSENGTNIHRVLNGTKVNCNNVYISDINQDLINEGAKSFGYKPVFVEENGILPFPDNFFDIVFCSSVIEHVTVSKEDIWQFYSGNRFKKISLKRQKEFANEIIRVGKQYFVQTPYRFFPVESHTWLPLIGFLPRFCLLSLLKLSNRIWIKKTNPDWNLLDKKQMGQLFPEAQLIQEKFLGLTKSIMAVQKKEQS